MLNIRHKSNTLSWTYDFITNMLTRLVMMEVSKAPSPGAWNADISWLMSSDPAGLHNQTN